MGAARFVKGPETWMPHSVAVQVAKPSPAKSAGQGAYVIVFGNEKGGTGKTTTAMHVAIALLKLGRKVAALDLDGRQRTLARYIENRAAFAERTGHALSMPQMHVVERAPNSHAAPEDEMTRFGKALASAREKADFIVIDTPGSDTALSRLGHAAADTLVTPMNDSFLDFDLLARLNPENLEVIGPSLYSEFVWDCRKRRLMARQRALDWVVMRNRVSAIEARNKRRIATAVDQLAERIGFRVSPGFSERVIFRELFPSGLTLFDLPLKGVDVALTMSHVAARQEIRKLLAMLQLPGLERAIARL
jgi:chromosome partitioning protein